MKQRLVFDPIRRLWTAATPEEIVRQKLLSKMVDDLQFPKDLICVEKDLRELPHLSNMRADLPDRRADIVCFAPGIHPDYPLYPLLLVECKEEILDQKAIDQLLGYNFYVKARFVAIANRKEMRYGYHDTDTYRFFPNLPSYSQLLEATRN